MIMYGMGDAMTAQRIGCTLAEAKKIKEDFFSGFPKVKEWIDYTHKFVHENGYVEDVWGRRRRLPDIKLPKYEITLESQEFNPILYTKGTFNDRNSAIISAYNEKLSRCKGKGEVEDIKKEAKSKGINIEDNSGFIATAERQSVNARVQGGSATMSKRAIVSLGHNPRLKELGFKPLILVHDEIIGECPIENCEEVKKLLSETMVNAALPEVKTPMRCDADSFINWYDDVYGADIRTENKNLIKSGMTEEEAFRQICLEHTECLESEIREFLDNVK